MLSELISSMSESISIRIDAQSASSISKPKERNMLKNFTYITRQILIWIKKIVTQMYNTIFYFNYILACITTIF